MRGIELGSYIDPGSGQRIGESFKRADYEDPEQKKLRLRNTLFGMLSWTGSLAVDLVVLTRFATDSPDFSYLRKDENGKREIVGFDPETQEITEVRPVSLRTLVGLKHKTDRELAEEKIYKHKKPNAPMVRYGGGFIPA